MTRMMLKPTLYMNLLTREWTRRGRNTERNGSKKIWRDTVKRGEILNLYLFIN